MTKIKAKTLMALRHQAEQEYACSLKPSESWDTHPSEYPQDVDDQELVHELIQLRVKELINQL